MLQLFCQKECHKKRLSRLVIVSIENKMLVELEYKNLIRILHLKI